MQRPLLPDWLAKIYVLLFALLPWSVEWPAGPGWNLTVPSEPLIAIACAGLFITLWRHGRKRPLQLPTTSPRSSAILNRLPPELSGHGPGMPGSSLVWVPALYLAWQGVAVLFSTMPLVSWKYYAVETGQWVAFFAVLALWPALWPRLIRVFAWSLAGVTVYALAHHAVYHFHADQAILAPKPFFADHTVFSVVLALVLLGWGAPRVLGLELDFFSNSSAGEMTPQAKQSALSRSRRITLALERAVLPALFVLALGLIVSRAAWLSLLLAGFAGAALYYRKYWPWFLFAALLAVGAGFVFRENIATRLSADVSSMERLNRYSCAWRMAQDRPETGFGPGTYQFQYLRYQRPEEMTRLSIVEPIARREPGKNGRGGGAHSEYVQALSETGWPGLFCWLLLAVGSVALGIRVYLLTGQVYWLFLSLSLLSFFLHGLVNNFLHDARVAALVWGQVAMVVGRASRQE